MDRFLRSVQLATLVSLLLFAGSIYNAIVCSGECRAGDYLGRFTLSLLDW